MPESPEADNVFVAETSIHTLKKKLAAISRTVEDMLHVVRVVQKVSSSGIFYTELSPGVFGKCVVETQCIFEVKLGECVFRGTLRSLYEKIAELVGTLDEERMFLRKQLGVSCKRKHRA